MTRPDFQRVYDHHKWIHGVLINWARWVTPSIGPQTSPMFRDYRSHAWQWHPKEYREACDILEAQEVERKVAKLPPQQREAIRWCYVYRCSPAAAIREMRVSYEALERLVHEARSMLDISCRSKDYWTEEAALELVKVKSKL